MSSLSRGQHVTYLGERLVVHSDGGHGWLWCLNRKGRLHRYWTAQLALDSVEVSHA